jgi:cytochrome c peroxidase
MIRIFRLKKTWWVASLFISVVLVQSCHPDETPITNPGDLTDIPFAPQPYTIIKPDHFPEVPVPDSNRMTLEGVQLGRMLFYDPILSADSSQSCSSCHLPQGSFTDNYAVSVGIDGISGRRSSMSLLNVGYVTNGLFWDGRVQSLEQQALMPVEDPIEMHNKWQSVIAKLKTHPVYPAMFRKAFGITDRDLITKELAAKAMAQFERILVSSGKSKFDEFQRGNPDVFDDEELDGKLMFFDEGKDYNLPDAQCFHCHGGITLTGNQYFNNGLDDVASLDAFADLGRGAVTGNRNDKGKFRSPTLRNIAMSAPYMHDGRFQTLEEAVAQYADNGFGVENEDIFIGQMGFPLGNGQYSGFSEYHKKALVKFLHALTDTTFVNNPDIKNPFH